MDKRTSIFEPYPFNFSGTFYTRFHNLNAEEKQKEFSTKIIPDIDSNNDNKISFEELHKWLLKTIKEQAPPMTGVDMDANKDDKITWEEFLESQMIG